MFTNPVVVQFNEQLPLQAEVVSPALFPYVPIGQGVQTEAPDKEYVPGEHNEHTVEPGDDHEPAGHIVQIKLDPEIPDCE
jgi:hypothetical protein